jgi:membrane protease YdiL (CAAX protease family)
LSQKEKLHDFFFSLDNTKKVIQIAFWTTFAFTILGVIFYPYFLNTPAIGWNDFIGYFPYFILYSVSNAFVEESFFRGVLLSKFSQWWGPSAGNNIQALLFALIHLMVIPFNPNASYFILFTFVLDISWDI